MIKCIVFDFDGTLVKSNKIKHQLFFEVAKAHGGTDCIVDDVIKEKAGEDRYAIFGEIANRVVKEMAFPLKSWHRFSSKIIPGLPRK